MSGTSTSAKTILARTEPPALTRRTSISASALLDMRVQPVERTLTNVCRGHVRMEEHAVKQRTRICAPVLRDTKESTAKQTRTTADQIRAYTELAETSLLATTVSAVQATRA